MCANHRFGLQQRKNRLRQRSCRSSRHWTFRASVLFRIRTAIAQCRPCQLGRALAMAPAVRAENEPLPVAQRTFQYRKTGPIRAETSRARTTARQGRRYVQCCANNSLQTITGPLLSRQARIGPSEWTGFGKNVTPQHVHVAVKTTRSVISNFNEYSVAVSVFRRSIKSGAEAAFMQSDAILTVKCLPHSLFGHLRNVT